MEKYKRITLYFKVDDPQDSLRYALIGSLGKGKKVIFDRMIDQYLQTYGIDNLEDLTLKDLQIIKKELMGIEVEQKEKRGRGRPKKVVEPKPPAQPITEVKETSENYAHNINAEKGEIKEEKVETIVELEKEEQRIEVHEEKKEEVKVENKPQSVKQKNPMAVNIDDDDDDDFNGGVDADLLGQMSAFF